MSRWIILIAFAGVCVAQAPPAFEVVSIKPLAPDAPFPTARPVRTAGRIQYPRISLSLLILQAYDVRPYQIDGPSWMMTQMYEFSAKIPEGVATDQIPLMLQGMLRDRFGLRTRWESKEQAVFALVVGKNRPKLKESSPETRETSQFLMLGHLETKHANISKFAMMLAGILGRPVLDNTGIEGYFDIVLDVDPADLVGPLFEPAKGLTSKNPSIFAALQEMGFKLESRKAPINHIVIDHVERIPSEN